MRESCSALRALARPFGMAPVGTREEGPPAVGIVPPHRPRGRGEDNRGRLQQRRVGAGIIGWIDGAFGQGAVAGGLHELLELGVGDQVAIHPEPLHAHPVGRGFLGVMIIGAHQVGAPRDPHHVTGRGATWPGRLRLWGVDLGGGSCHKGRRGRCAGEGGRPQELPRVEVIFSIASLTVKLAAFWRGGKALRVSRAWATLAWAGISRKTWSSSQSK